MANGYKKKAPAKRAPMRRAPVKRAMKPRRAPMFDGINGIASAYFEISRTNAANSAEPLSYTIRCDPNNPKLKIGSNAVNLDTTTVGIKTNKGDGTELITTGQQSHDISVAKFNALKTNYLQYKVNSVQIKVLVDKNCLDNQVCFSTDKGTPTPLSNMAQVMSGAGKRYTPTDSRREFSYGWKPSANSLEKQFVTLSSQINPDDANFIKIFQEMEPQENVNTCTHRVSVLISYTLKDSAHLN